MVLATITFLTSIKDGGGGGGGGGSIEGICGSAATVVVVEANVAPPPPPVVPTTPAAAAAAAAFLAAVADMGMQRAVVAPSFRFRLLLTLTVAFLARFLSAAAKLDPPALPAPLLMWLMVRAGGVTAGEDEADPPERVEGGVFADVTGDTSGTAADGFSAFVEGCPVNKEINYTLTFFRLLFLCKFVISSSVSHSSLNCSVGRDFYFLSGRLLG